MSLTAIFRGLGFKGLGVQGLGFKGVLKMFLVAIISA